MSSPTDGVRDPGGVDKRFGPFVSTVVIRELNPS